MGNSSSSQDARSALAAPQGEERTATSKTRRRRSDTSGTRFFASTRYDWKRVPEVSLTTRPAHTRRGPFPTRHPPWRVRAIQLSVTPLAVSAPRCLHLRRGERRASQQHGPRRAPPAPSLLPPVHLHYLLLKEMLRRTYANHHVNVRIT